MTTYAKLEVNQDGELLQSSYAVPSDGVLPHAQRSSPTPKHLKTYSLTLFPRTAIVSLTGDETAMRITGLYFPTHIRGLQHLRLLGPIIVSAIVVYGIVGLLLIQHTFPPFTLALISLIVIGISSLLVFWPAIMWFKYLYYQGAPTYRVQRKVMKNYPNIPVYHDLETFVLDTQE